MKKIKNPIYFRYEFSDESGKPEGGDIFQFSTQAKVMAMIGKILKVAQSDNVAVNLTIGQEESFFGYLNEMGLSREDAETEMVDLTIIPAAAKKSSVKKKAAKKKPAKKKASKKKSVK